MYPSLAVNLTWQLACLEAPYSKREMVEPEHFLAALTKLKQVSLAELAKNMPLQGTDPADLRSELSLVPDLLEAVHIDPDRFRRDLRNRQGLGTHEHQEGDSIHRSPRSRRLFDQTGAIAAEMGATEIHCGHLFLAILQEEDSPGCRLLVEEGADLRTLVRRTREYLENRRLQQRDHKAVAPDQAQAGSQTPFLDNLGIDLTAQARAGRLGPVIGRRREILQVLRTLARQSKNNPVLVGEAGVGKTAIVEALALRAVQGKNPEVLGGKRIIALNMSAVVAGAKYRGDFEQRLCGALDECRKHPDVLLFLDELHTVVGAGNAEGGLDAANILKPALARGDVRCIGATTTYEYRRYIETDSALERRFAKVLVTEPSREETLEILHGLRGRLQEHHGATFGDAALEAAVDLSMRFDCDHHLPDKAIDLLDAAGARMQIPTLSVRWDPDDSHCEPLLAEAGPPAGEVTVQSVMQVLAEKLGIPAEVLPGHVQGLSRSHFLEMAQFLKTRVIGQDSAIDRVCQRLLLAQTGFNERRGPLGVFLFLGPTGVGKTELARSLATFLFGSERDMIRLDMSEYMEEHSVARLIGSPPGYIGHEEEGQLTGRLRSRPYSVVLLDEVEKAHPRIMDVFLQVFDEGRLTDAKGRLADARHAIFIMTSNLPADRDFGFRHKDTAESKRLVFDEVERRFRKEFLNRIDEQIAFRPLDFRDVKTILERRLEEISQTSLNKHQKPVYFTGPVADVVAGQAYSEEYGARDVYRTVERLIESPLLTLMLSGTSAAWPAIEVTVQDGKLAFLCYRGGTL